MVTEEQEILSEAIARNGYAFVHAAAMRDLLSGALTAAVRIGVERQIDGTRGAFAQLMKLRGVQARA